MKNDGKVIINSHFSSRTDDEIAKSMSAIIAKLVNRDLENLYESKDIKTEEAVTLSM